MECLSPLPVIRFICCFTSCWIKPLHRIKWECPFPIDISITIANWNIDFRYTYGLTNMLLPASCSHFRQFFFRSILFFRLLAIFLYAIDYLSNLALCSMMSAVSVPFVEQSFLFVYHNQTRLKSIPKSKHTDDSRPCEWLLAMWQTNLNLVWKTISNENVDSDSSTCNGQSKSYYNMGIKMFQSICHNTTFYLMPWKQQIFRNPLCIRWQRPTTKSVQFIFNTKTTSISLSAHNNKFKRTKNQSYLIHLIRFFSLNPMKNGVKRSNVIMTSTWFLNTFIPTKITSFSHVEFPCNTSLMLVLAAAAIGMWTNEIWVAWDCYQFAFKWL